MDWSRSNWEKLMRLSEVASKEEEEDPLASIDPPLVAAVRNPQYRGIVLSLEEKIQKFIIEDSRIIKFPRFKTPYLTDIAHMLARLYGLEPLSADNRIFCRTPSSRMPWRTLSSIPPFEPERRVIPSKEMEEFFNPVHLSSISPVVPHSTSPVHGGTIKEGGQDPSALSSMLAPLSLELLPLPRSEAAQPPRSSNSVPVQDQDIVDFPHPMEDNEPIFSAERPQQRRRLRD